MTTHTIYSTALVCHIIGIIMMAGTTFSDYVIFKQFWKQLAIDKLKGIAVNQAMSKSALLFGLGFLLIIISGIIMMYITHGIFGEQTWFRIKFGLILLIVINGLIIGRRQGVKLKKLLAWEAPAKNVEDDLLKTKRNLNLFHISQMVLFTIIFVLSIFKFN
jgi:hypothetical protein